MIPVKICLFYFYHNKLINILYTEPLTLSLNVICLYAVCMHNIDTCLDCNLQKQPSIKPHLFQNMVLLTVFVHYLSSLAKIRNFKHRINTFYCAGPIWYTSSFAVREHVSSDIEQKPNVFLRKHRISGFFSALFLIYPSVCRGRNFSWKVEQGRGFYACRKHSSEWWPKAVRSEAITT